jgi:hypothetical protein
MDEGHAGSNGEGGVGYAADHVKFGALHSAPHRLGDLAGALGGVASGIIALWQRVWYAAQQQGQPGVTDWFQNYSSSKLTFFKMSG